MKNNENNIDYVEFTRKAVISILSYNSTSESLIEVYNLSNDDKLLLEHIKALKKYLLKQKIY